MEEKSWWEEQEEISMEIGNYIPVEGVDYFTKTPLRFRIKNFFDPRVEKMTRAKKRELGLL